MLIFTSPTKFNVVNVVNVVNFIFLKFLENDTLKVIVSLRDFNFRFYGKDHFINVKASNNT
jgi:hypothetical protein